jgi:tRNA modification GTPase
MYATDTICAIATPPGEGGIGIIRLSGDKAVEIASRIFRSPTGRTVKDYATHTLHVGDLHDPETGLRLDQVLVAVLKAPRTYTREDVVEFHCHGSPLVLRLALQNLIRSGARLAQPGEFTKRAFLNGRLDLAQAEAVMDLIQARSESGLRLAVEQLRGKLSEELGRIREALLRLLVEVEAGIDFLEDDIAFISTEALSNGIEAVVNQIRGLIGSADDGRIVREGITVVLVGRPNVGKSSLLNALARADRAIVTDIPGTTRDVLEEFVSIRGIPVRLLDTAGLRESGDRVEREGVRRAEEALQRADLVLIILDGSARLESEDRQVLALTAGKSRLVVANKMDRGASWEFSELAPGSAVQERMVRTSALHGTGLDELQDAIRGAVLTQGAEPMEGVVVTHLRHRVALEKAKASLGHVQVSLERRMPAECIAMDLRGAINAIGEIIGETTVDDVLDRIFQEFCVGK